MLDDFACAVLNFVSFVRGMIFRKGTVQLSLLISPFQVDAVQRQNVEEDEEGGIDDGSSCFGSVGEG